MIFVGDDWAEDHHDIYVMDADGARLASRRLPEGLPGIGGFHELVAAHAEEPSQVVIGIETDRGLWVGALSAAGYRVYAVNPLAVAHYRDRHHVSGAKSDAGDAKLLADLVRTDRHNHRPIAGDSAEAEAIKVLARGASEPDLDPHPTHQRAAQRAARVLPGRAGGLRGPRPRRRLGVLGRAPTPEQGAHLSLTAIQSALKRGGRQRNIAARAREIQAALGTEQLAAPATVTAAFAATTRAAVGIIAELNRQIGELEASLAAHFETHPDADIYLSQPGLGVVLGARVLGEFGDDPNRYTDAKSRKNYAGTSPLTVASGKKRAVLARHVRNRRLYDAIDQWAFCGPVGQPRRPRVLRPTPRRRTTPTTKPCAPWATASSASCTAAYATTPATTNTPPGHTAPRPRLDTLRPWDVYSSQH